MSDATAGAEAPRVVRRETDLHVALVTIDRPEARNALSEAVRAQLADALHAADADPDVRVIILTGAGDRAFASGADITELDRRTLEEQRELMRDGGVFGAVARIRKPIVAAINGYCLGGGLELALACDIRIASDAAKFGQPEVSLGLIPGGGATQILPRIIGMGHALRLVLTGEVIDANEALRIDLVHEIAPPGMLLFRARSIADAIAARSPVAVAAAKQAVRAALDRPLDDGRVAERELFERCFTSADKIEGVRAFLEKRAPQFPGR